MLGDKNFDTISTNAENEFTSKKYMSVDGGLSATSGQKWKKLISLPILSGAPLSGVINLKSNGPIPHSSMQ